MSATRTIGRLAGTPRRWQALALACGVIGIGAASPSLAAAASAASGSTGSAGATGATGTTGAAGPSAPARELSSNWAGYAVTGGAVRNFKHVAASWIQPAVLCAPGATTYSAFWVGLGGMSQSSRKLEQTGTEADCDANGVAHYSAWYELVPAGPARLKLAVGAGDSVSASVSVRGPNVTFSLVDHTTGAHATKRLRFPHANLSSAEWIAEAPSNCAAACQTLPLTDFGTVSFQHASVRTGNGTAGTISNSLWLAQPIALSEPSGGAAGTRFLGARAVVTAAPTVLDPTGSAFSVTWAQQPGATAGGGPVLPGFGT